MKAAKSTYKRSAAAPAKKKGRRKKNVKFSDEVEVEDKLDEEGGKIIKPKKRSPKRSPTIQAAIAETMKGGKIEKPKKRSPKKDQKIEEAIQTKMQSGGKLKFHDPIHRHLHKNLSGRGGRFDPPFVRQKMHQMMSAYHPSIFHSYMSGKPQDIPQDNHYAPGRPIQRVRKDPRPTIVDMGGSLNALTHSENGLLQSFDSTFHSYLEIV